MAWQAVAANVSGILFFCYHNEIHSNRACDNPQGWADLSSVAGELQSLMPALLAPPTDRMQCTTNVQATFRTVGDEIWGLLTNPRREPRCATIDLPAGAGKAIVRDCIADSAGFEVSNSFPVELEPCGVRAIRIAF